MHSFSCLVLLLVLHGHQLDGRFISPIDKRSPNRTKTRLLHKDVVEGDIMLRADQFASFPAFPGESIDNFEPLLWEERVVPFVIDDSLTEPFTLDMVRQAAEYYSDRTCFSIIEDTEDKYSNRIRILSDRGCYSVLGRVDGAEQPLSLQNGDCWTFATVAHELGHALGLFHTQSRPDRDRYIYVNKPVISKDGDGQFDRHSELLKNYHGIPYEFGSIMHYDPDSFAKFAHVPTLIAKGQFALYQNSMGGYMPSFYDVQLINRMYNCSDQCDSSLITCQNGGYQDPKKCRSCLCPEGWGGADCTKSPPGSILLNATLLPQTITMAVGGIGEKGKMEYILNAPPKRRVLVTLLSATGDSFCELRGIEFKPAADLRPRGFRHCSSPIRRFVYTSETNRFPIIIYSLTSKKFTARIQYQWIY